MDVLVAGAGIAGLACARELSDAGVTVRVVERGRVVGGRLASKRFNGRYSDIGAAYLVTDDPDFHALAEQWRGKGLARPWTDTFTVFDTEKVFPGEPVTGPVRWAAPGGLRSLAVDLAEGLDVTLGTELRELPRTDHVVLAMPGPQALRLEASGVVADAARAQSWEPVIAVVLTYQERVWSGLTGAFVNDHPVLATVCDDGSRRGDDAPVLVAHTTAELAREHLGNPAAAGPIVAQAVGELLQISQEPSVNAHRWTYAQPAPGDGHLATDGRVWLAGDAFGKPRVQTAWLSGRAVARAILDQGR